MICPWCGAAITGHHTTCPECGVILAGIPVPAATQAQVARRRHRISWVLLILPLLCMTLVPLGIILVYHASVSGETVAQSTSQSPRYADAARESVWQDGKQAIRARLADPGLHNFSHSAVETSAGQLLTLCGSVSVPGNGTSRFLSLWGMAQNTEVEIWDPDFDILWTRLCGDMAQ